MNFLPLKLMSASIMDDLGAKGERLIEVAGTLLQRVLTSLRCAFRVVGIT